MRIGVFTLALTLFSAAITLAQTNSSLYTPLAEKQCKTIRSVDPQSGDYEGHCRGVAGYSLIVTEGDLRQNVTVVTPKGARHSLDCGMSLAVVFRALDQGPSGGWPNKTENPSLSH